MSRLQSKCLIASVAGHGLLLVILLVAPAFLQRFHKDNPEEAPTKPMEVVPAGLIDGMTQAGGNPAITKPVEQTAPPPVAPVPVPEPVTPPPPVEVAPPVADVPDVKPQPEPAPRVQVPVKTVDSAEEPDVPEKVTVNPKSLNTSTKKKPTPKRDEEPSKSAKNSKPAPKTEKPSSKVAVNLNPVTRDQPDAKALAKIREARERAEQAKAEREAQADYQRQRRAAINSTLRTLENGLSGGTAVEMPGPNQQAFANYADWVKDVYDRAWLVGDEVTDSQSTVKVSVTVSRDGTIASAHIIQRSGNVDLDNSIQRAIYRVKSIGYPFPEGARETQRTFIINFNLKAKRLLG